MKTVFFYTDTPMYGGAERMMLTLAKNIDPKKYNVELACSRYPALNEWCQEWEKAGRRVHRLNVVHKHDPRHLTGLKKLLKARRPDILHIHLWNPASCRYAFAATHGAKRSAPTPKKDKKSARADFSKKKSDIKVITTEHDPFPLTSRTKKLLKKRALAKTDKIITVSAENKHLMETLYPNCTKKLVTILNGVDLKAFEQKLQPVSPSQIKKIRADIMKARPDEFIMVTVAALHPRKGLKHLIKAFSLLLSEPLKKTAPLRLVIVGEGPERKPLENFIKILDLSGKVTLAGKQENIPALLKSADLFVLPSVKEAFGLAAVEAMAAGLPVVVSKTGGLAEIVEDGVSGILTEPGNIQELKEAMGKLIQDKALRKKLGENAKKRAEKFTIQNVARKTQAVYDKLLKK